MPSYRVCPDCREQLSPEARRCVCGWKEDRGPAKDPFHGLCSYTDGGDRCRFPGSISAEQRGGGRWQCVFHFFGGGGFYGAEVVKQSFDWDGKAESFAALRKAYANRAAVDVVGGSSRVDAVPATIQELVQKLGIPLPQKKAA